MCIVFTNLRNLLDDEVGVVRRGAARHRRALHLVGVRVRVRVGARVRVRVRVWARVRVGAEARARDRLGIGSG